MQACTYVLQKSTYLRMYVCMYVCMCVYVCMYVRNIMKLCYRTQYMCCASMFYQN